MNVVSSFRYEGVVVFQLVGHCCLGYRQPQCTTIPQHISVPSLTKSHDWEGVHGLKKPITAVFIPINNYTQSHWGCFYKVTCKSHVQGHM